MNGERTRTDLTKRDPSTGSRPESRTPASSKGDLRRPFRAGLSLIVQPSGTKSSVPPLPERRRAEQQQARAAVQCVSTASAAAHASPGRPRPSQSPAPSRKREQPPSEKRLGEDRAGEPTPQVAEGASEGRREERRQSRQQPCSTLSARPLPAAAHRTARGCAARSNAFFKAEILPAIGAPGRSRRSSERGRDRVRSTRSSNAGSWNLGEPLSRLRPRLPRLGEGAQDRRWIDRGRRASRRRSQEISARPRAIRPGDAGSCRRRPERHRGALRPCLPGCCSSTGARAP